LQNAVKIDVAARSLNNGRTEVCVLQHLHSVKAFSFPQCLEHRKHVWIFNSAWSNKVWPAGHFNKTWQLVGHF